MSQDPTAVSGGVGILNKTYQTSGGFPGGSVVKNLLPMQETWVQSLRWEDPLEEEMITHSSILARKIHGQRSLVGCSPWCRKESDTS